MGNNSILFCFSTLVLMPNCFVFFFNSPLKVNANVSLKMRHFNRIQDSYQRCAHGNTAAGSWKSSTLKGVKYILGQVKVCLVSTSWLYHSEGDFFSYCSDRSGMGRDRREAANIQGYWNLQLEIGFHLCPKVINQANFLNTQQDSQNLICRSADYLQLKWKTMQTTF